MLIIGDVSTKKFNNKHIVRVIEIIYHDSEELELIFTHYNLPRPETLGSTYNEIKLGEFTYKLYSKNLCKIFSKIMKDSFARKGEFVVANPFINFLFDSTKVVNYHAQLKSWTNSISSYTFLANEFVKDIVDMDDKYNYIIDKYHKMLFPYISCQKSIKTSPYRYNPYTTATKDKLLSIVAIHFVNMSPYNIIHEDFPENEQEYLNEKRFDQLTYHRQIIACLESLYIDTLNEFIIPYIQETKNQPDFREVYLFFQRSIMNRLSQGSMLWFNYFILENYNEIIESYDVGFYNCFVNTLREGELIVT